jgi:hypothetical protein
MDEENGVTQEQTTLEQLRAELKEVRELLAISTTDLKSFKAKINSEQKARRIAMEKAGVLGGDDEHPKAPPPAQSAESPWVRRLMKDKLSSMGIDGENLDSLATEMASMTPERADLFLDVLQRSGRQPTASQSGKQPIYTQDTIQTIPQSKGRAGAAASPGDVSHKKVSTISDLSKLSKKERDAWIEQAAPDEIAKMTGD